MGESNWMRSLANSTAASKAPWATPTACAPTPGLDWSKVFMVTMKPMPGLPMMRSFGMRQSVKTSSRVDDERMPIFFSFFPNPKPGSPFSRMNALAPLGPFDLSVMAITE